MIVYIVTQTLRGLLTHMSQEPSFHTLFNTAFSYFYLRLRNLLRRPPSPTTVLPLRADNTDHNAIMV